MDQQRTQQDREEQLNQRPMQLFRSERVDAQSDLGKHKVGPDRNRVVCIGESVAIQEEKGVLSLPRDKNERAKREAVFPSGRLLALESAADHLFCFGEEEGNRLLRVYKGAMDEMVSETKLKHKKQGELMSVSPDGLTVALGYQDGSVVLLKAKKLQEAFKENILVEASRDTYQIRGLAVVEAKKSEPMVFYITQEGLFAKSTKGSKVTEIDKRRFSLLTGCHSRGGVFVLEEQSQRVLEFNSVEEVAGSRSVATLNNKDSLRERQDNNLRIDTLLTFGDAYLVALLQIQGNSKDIRRPQLIIYDLVNEFLAHREQHQFRAIRQVAPAQDKLVYLALALPHKGDEWTFQTLTELSFREKMEIFFNKKSFSLALRFARNNGATKEQQAEISRMHGDYKYSQGDFEEALKHYLATIGHIEVSYVNRKFLEAQHMDYLIRYLEELHSLGKQDKHHTSQLLNCYVKKKDVEKLKSFVEQRKDKVGSELFDSEAAIQVCRELKQDALALQLASKDPRHTELYLRILMEKDKEDALKHIQHSLDLHNKVKWFKEFGQQFVQKEDQVGRLALEFCKNLLLLRFEKGRLQSPPTDDQKRLKAYFHLDTLEEVKDLKLPSVDDFVGLFYSASHQESNLLTELLEFLQNNQYQLDHMEQQVVVRQLIEVYLGVYSRQLEDPQANRETNVHDHALLADPKNKIMTLLEAHKQLQVDSYNQLMVLFKIHNFEQGIVHLLQSTGRSLELLQYYMGHPNPDNKAKMLEVCRQKGEADLYIQTLRFLLTSYCSERESEINRRLVQEAMHQLAQLNDPSPLMLLNIIQKVYTDLDQRKQRELQFGDVKNYFKKKTKDILKTVDENRKTVKQKQDDQKKSYSKYYELKTRGKTFQATQCSACKDKLRNPSVHFYCDHSYDQNCLLKQNDQQECDQPSCIDNRNTVTQRKATFDTTDYSNAINQKFHDTKDNYFDVVAQFIAVGLFRPDQMTTHR